MKERKYGGRALQAKEGRKEANVNALTTAIIRHDVWSHSSMYSLPWQEMGANGRNYPRGKKLPTR